MAEQQQLSGTIVVIIIAMAVQVCIMLVIVVKRQIMRFALRNRRGPHTHIGQGGPKALRREIDRRLEYVSHIKHEPPLTSEVDNGACQTRTSYRVAAVEEIRMFENDLACFSASFIRMPCGNLRSFLLNCIGGPLRGVDHYLIHQVCDDYDHARHHFEDFNQEKFNVFQSRVNVLRQRLESNRSGAANWTSTSLGGSPSPRDQASKKKDKKSKEKKQQQQQRESRALLVTSTNSANCTPV